MKHFIIITELPANHCPHLSNSCRAVRAVLSQAVSQQKLQSQQEWHSGRQREDLRMFQGNGSPSNTVCWVRRVNRHCPVKHQAMEGTEMEKTKAIPLPEELLQGFMADKPFTSLEDYCRFLSQQEDTSNRGSSVRRSASAAAPTATRNWLSETPPGHVQGALLVLPAQHSTPGLEELALSKDIKRTGNFSWLFTDNVS